MYQGFTYNVIEELPKIVTNITIKEIAQEQGTVIVHYHIKTPFIVSNRCIFNAYYHIHSAETNGEYTFITSSAGNEEYVENNYELIGKDVLADMPINYVNIKPIFDGTNDDGTPKITGSRII